MARFVHNSLDKENSRLRDELIMEDKEYHVKDWLSTLLHTHTDTNDIAPKPPLLNQPTDNMPKIPPLLSRGLIRPARTLAQEHAGKSPLSPRTPTPWERANRLAARQAWIAWFGGLVSTATVVGLGIWSFEHVLVQMPKWLVTTILVSAVCVWAYWRNVLRALWQAVDTFPTWWDEYWVMGSKSRRRVWRLTLIILWYIIEFWRAVIRDVKAGWKEGDLLPRPRLRRPFLFMKGAIFKEEYYVHPQNTILKRRRTSRKVLRALGLRFQEFDRENLVVLQLLKEGDVQTIFRLSELVRRERRKPTESTSDSDDISGYDAQDANSENGGGVNVKDGRKRPTYPPPPYAESVADTDEDERNNHLDSSLDRDGSRQTSGNVKPKHPTPPRVVRRPTPEWITSDTPPVYSPLTTAESVSELGDDNTPNHLSADSKDASSRKGDGDRIDENLRKPLPRKPLPSRTVRWPQSESTAQNDRTLDAVRLKRRSDKPTTSSSPEKPTHTDPIPPDQAPVPRTHLPRGCLFFLKTLMDKVTLVHRDCESLRNKHDDLIQAKQPIDLLLPAEQLLQQTRALEFHFYLSFPAGPCVAPRIYVAEVEVLKIKLADSLSLLKRLGEDLDVDNPAGRVLGKARAQLRGRMNGVATVLENLVVETGGDDVEDEAVKATRYATTKVEKEKVGTRQKISKNLKEEEVEKEATQQNADKITTEAKKEDERPKDSGRTTTQTNWKPSNQNGPAPSPTQRNSPKPKPKENELYFRLLRDWTAQGYLPTETSGERLLCGLRALIISLENIGRIDRGAVTPDQILQRMFKNPQIPERWDYRTHADGPVGEPTREYQEYLDEYLGHLEDQALADEFRCFCFKNNFEQGQLVAILRLMYGWKMIKGGDNLSLGVVTLQEGKTPNEKDITVAIYGTNPCRNPVNGNIVWVYNNNAHEDGFNHWSGFARNADDHEQWRWLVPIVERTSP